MCNNKIIPKGDKPVSTISNLVATTKSQQGIIATSGTWKNRQDIKKITRQHSRFGQVKLQSALDLVNQLAGSVKISPKIKTRDLDKIIETSKKNYFKNY